MEFSRVAHWPLDPRTLFTLFPINIAERANSLSSRSGIFLKEMALPEEGKFADFLSPRDVVTRMHALRVTRSVRSVSIARVAVSASNAAIMTDNERRNEVSNVSSRANRRPGNLSLVSCLR